MPWALCGSHLRVFLVSLDLLYYMRIEYLYQGWPSKLRGRSVAMWSPTKRKPHPSSSTLDPDSIPDSGAKNYVVFRLGRVGKEQAG